MVQLYVILPVSGGGQIDNSLPGSGNYPSQPIYHPGHPDHGHLPYPDQGLPGGGSSGSGARPSHPIHIPGVPDQGLPEPTPIPPDQINPPLPEPPSEYANDLVIAVHKPGEPWDVYAYDIQPDQGQPTPTPQQQHRRR
jgi:hypothetical protein